MRTKVSKQVQATSKGDTTGGDIPFEDWEVQHHPDGRTIWRIRNQSPVLTVHAFSNWVNNHPEVKKHNGA